MKVKLIVCYIIQSSVLTKAPKFPFASMNEVYHQTETVITSKQIFCLQTTTTKKYNEISAFFFSTLDTRQKLKRNDAYKKNHLNVMCTQLLMILPTFCFISACLVSKRCSILSGSILTFTTFFHIVSPLVDGCGISGCTVFQ